MSSRPTDFLATLRGGRLLIALVLLIGVVAGLGRAATAVYVELLWQAQAGYTGVFWRRLRWEWGTQIIAGLAVAALVFLNLRIAATTLGGIQIRRRFGNIEISEQIPRRYVTWSLVSAALLIGLWFGASVPDSTGRQILLALSADGWGLADPVLGRDVGFYAFWLPVFGAVLTYGMIVAFLVFTLATAGYAATGAVSWVGGRFRAHSVARMHLGSILGFFFLLLAFRLWLGRYELLLQGSSEVQGIFGFTDHQARMPALQTLAVLCFAASVATVWGAVRNLAWPLVASFTSVVLGTVLIGNVYPSIVQSFRVEPNELQRETPYIRYSLDFTRGAFGLDEMVRRPLGYRADAPVDWEEAAEQFAGLPVWGAEPLRTTFEQEQARFSYYGFDGVAIDRYRTSDGRSVPVAVSVRQIEASGIQDADSWQNLHLRERYVAGMGAVAGLATGRTAQAKPRLLLAGIPPEVVPEASVEARLTLGLERPEVFFGTRNSRLQPYAVVSRRPDEYLAPDSTEGVAGVDFPEGIPLGGLARTALLAWHFGAANLLFSSEVGDDSRLVHRRSVLQRASAIAPFLRFPEAPYPVIAEGRIVWILEGFTATAWFPLAAQQQFPTIRPAVRYVRNSVKVTVDAVTGDVTFYRVPVNDPLADAYEEAYPGLFRAMAEMPAPVREHLRYPRSLLDLQGRVLLDYHQETAQAFHGRQDVWRKPTELAKSTQPEPYEAEYGIYRLPGDDQPRFRLTTAFVPAGRENLTAIFAAGTDEMGRPETILLDVPVADEVLGPRQIEARVEQDPAISEQFSLWRTGGSEVWTGHLHLVPVGNRLLYMEPVFLAATDDAIPELRRFVVSDGRRVAMTETLAEGIAVLAGAAPPPAVQADADVPPTETGLPPMEAWPAAALELLEEAESRARDGDWQGFGVALDELRSLLESLQRAGG
jgi:uncharacterized membrane protein (UPF0182 family)